MGLDSYLYTSSKELANAVADWMEAHDEDYSNIEWCREDGMICYWRKYSPIHSWMVENIQDGNDDCGIYEINYAQMMNLYETVCQEYNDPGSTDFQPTNNFFFSPSDIDEWNKNYLEYTYNFLNFLIDKIEEYRYNSICFKGENWNAHICYGSSWQ